MIDPPDLRNTNWKNLPTSRATSFSNHDVARTGQSQPADDVVESKLTMPVLQAVLEVIDPPDLRNTNWKNLPTSRATSFSNHDVAHNSRTGSVSRSAILLLEQIQSASCLKSKQETQ